MRKFFYLSLLCVASSCLGRSLDIIEFDGPDNAPIYVIDGDINYNDTINGLTVGMDWSSSMNAATGSLAGKGDYTISGRVNY